MKQRRVLCYGDSNTWGQYPFVHKQYSEDIRWTKQLEVMSDGALEVIEEGLGGRCAGNIHDEKPELNGLAHFTPILQSHLPFDLLLIGLGTNDLKQKFHQTPEMITDNLLEYERITHQLTPTTQTIYILPPTFTTNDPKFAGANEKVTQYKALLTKQSKAIIDLQQIVVDSEDGLHYTPNNHTEVANIIFSEISTNF